MRKAVILTFDERVDRRILRESESLAAAGFEVIGVAFPRNGAETDPDPPWLRRISAPPAAQSLSPYRVWARFGRPLAARFPAVRRVAIAAKRWLTRGHLYDPLAHFDALMYPAARRIAADVYIAHDLPMLPTAVRCAREHGAAAVYDSHELWPEQEFEASVRARWAALENEWIGQADAVMAVNASIADELERRYGVREVSVVHNADHPLAPPDAPPRRLHRAFDLPDDARIVLFQGGFSMTRNLDVLIRAFLHVGDPSLHLVMLGWGEAALPLQRLAASLGLQRRVHFHPKVPQDELLAYTQCADLGVIPYQPICLNNRYCTPNKLFEFIAAGVPIVGTDLPELRRFIVGLDIGLVGDTATPQSLAGLIEDYFADPARQSRLRANVRRAQPGACWAVESKGFLESVERAIRNANARGQACEPPPLAPIASVSRS